MKHSDFKLAPFSCFVVFIVLRVDIIQGFSFAEREKEKRNVRDGNGRREQSKHEGLKMS